MPKDEANKLLEELGITSLPIIPEELCEKLEIHYVEKPLSSIDGLLVIDPANMGGVICVNSLIAEKGRKNFTGAHELGHYCMDGLEANEFYCASSMIGANSYKNSPVELRANEFAAELLMPRFIYQTLVDLHEPGWDGIGKLSRMSQTSDLATMIRYIEMTEESCALMVCENKKISWFRKSNSFSLYIDMDSRYVAAGTPTHKAFEGSCPSDSFESVSATNWVKGKQVNKYSEILEWALPMNPYGQVLTLLYDDEGIGEQDDDSTDGAGDDIWPWEPPTFHKSRRK